MIRVIAVLSLFALVISSSPVATAQTEAWPETRVVVKGRTAAGPILWHVTNGESQVVILGVLPVFPKKQTWQTTRVANALRGARGLITPPASSTGVGDIWSLMTNKGLPKHGALKDALPAALYARYEGAGRRAGVDIRDFAHDKPVWAGARLRREVLQRRGLTDDEPVQTVVALAHRAGVPVHAAGRYDMGPMIKSVNAMNGAASQACLGYTLDDIDFDLDRAPVAAKAWTIGDLATVRNNYQGSTLMKCLAGSDTSASINTRSVNDSVAAVTAALAKPGKTVAVLPLALLLRSGGVLDRLRAKGYEVSNP